MPQTKEFYACIYCGSCKYSGSPQGKPTKPLPVRVAKSGVHFYILWNTQAGGNWMVWEEYTEEILQWPAKLIGQFWRFLQFSVLRHELQGLDSKFVFISTSSTESANAQGEIMDGNRRHKKLLEVRLGLVVFF